jgi:hypothetical protein
MFSEKCSVIQGQREVFSFHEFSIHGLYLHVLLYTITALTTHFFNMMFELEKHCKLLGFLQNQMKK